MNISEERWATMIKEVKRVSEANNYKEEEDEKTDFLDKLARKVHNFQIWSHGEKDLQPLRYYWKAKSGVNQWEYSDEPSDSPEEALLDFLSQVARFTLEKNG